MAYADDIRTTDYTREELANLIAGNRQLHAAITTAGTAPAYEVTLDQAPTAYVTGQIFAIRIHTNLTTNAGATLNVNGLGAKSLKVAAAGNALRDPVALELGQRQVHYVTYDGTDDVFRILNPNFAYQWIQWTPTLGGSGTLALVGTQDTWYQYIGSNLIRLHLVSYVSLTVSTSTYIEFSLPVSRATDDETTVQPSFVSSVLGYTSYSSEAFITGNALRFLRSDQQSFPIDTELRFHASAIYNGAF